MQKLMLLLLQESSLKSSKKYNYYKIIKYKYN